VGHNTRLLCPFSTQATNFSTTPYGVVFEDSTDTPSNGWITGGAVTYGFNITSGTVNAGDVVYVSGSSMAPVSTKLRTINTAITNGDCFGDANLTLTSTGANRKGHIIIDPP
jgi:hypothetical protein